MLTLFRRAFRQHLPLLLAVMAAAVLFEVLVVFVIAQLDRTAGLQQFIQTMLPPAMQILVFEQFGWASFPGAVAFGFQHPLTLVAACALVIVLASIPAAERESGWIDLVLARPVTRVRYLLTHLLLIVIAALLVPAALLAGAAWGLHLADGPGELPWTRYIPAAVGLACLLLLVGGYALMFAAEARRRGIAVTRAVAITLLFYWLHFMGGFWDALQTARWLSPFRYYDPVRASIGEGLGWRDPLLLLGLAAACICLAVNGFRRQDL